MGKGIIVGIILLAVLATLLITDGILSGIQASTKDTNNPEMYIYIYNTLGVIVTMLAFIGIFIGSIAGGNKFIIIGVSEIFALCGLLLMSVTTAYIYGSANYNVTNTLNYENIVVGLNTATLFVGAISAFALPIFIGLIR
jgi:hypothetical protein